MILKQTGKDVPPGAFKQGVLTATNKALFPAVHATAISLKEQRVNYAVVDHGLTDDQQGLLLDLDVMLLQDMLPEVHSNGGLSQKYPNIPAKTWRKPRLCINSPFAMTAWIDADAIPLGYAHELFQWRKGFLTLDHFVDDEWAKEEYSPLIDALGGGEITRINSGVFAFPRGANWLMKWQQMCTAILLDKRLAELAHCRDQSAMVAVMSTFFKQNDDKPTLLSQPHWNYPADGFRNDRAAERMRDYPKTGPELLGFARERHPGVTVVHWMGERKCWMLN
jgi:hypothetical protein